MNLEETQKINKLAKELLAHHIVESSHEAMAKAEQMILGKSGSEEVKQEAFVQEDNEIRYIHANIAQLHADIRKLAADISGLKSGYESLKNSFVSIKERDSVPSSAPSASPSPAVQQQSRPEASPSRMGGFSDEQVAIDKIFYFGKK